MDTERIQRWYGELEGREVLAVCGTSGEQITRSQSSPHHRLVFPGAFNPLHNGHRCMADLAEERLGISVEFEISLENVDKPTLDLHDVQARLQQFPPTQRVWLTRARHFVEKSEVFGKVTFIVGADTIGRIADSKYYVSEQQRDEAIAQIASRGGRFLVFGRTREGQFETLESLRLPPELREICDEVSSGDFRADVSSTEIRIARGRP
mgnify:FL=1